MKRELRWSLLLAAVAAVFQCAHAPAVAAASLKAKVLDIEGKSVAGAKVFLYDSPNVRRPADFISPVSDRDGRVQIALPAGRYWVVARVKNDGKYGPLAPGDRHSGEPLEIEVTGEGGTEAEFVVADIREVGQKKRSATADVVRLRGRILDGEGHPVPNAYVFAQRTQAVEQVPDYLSAWTDGDGTYELYVPAGERWFLGAATSFPPPATLSAAREFVSGGEKIDIAIDIQLTVR